MSNDRLNLADQGVSLPVSGKPAARSRKGPSRTRVPPVAAQPTPPSPRRRVLDVLLTSLQAAVPLNILEMRDLSAAKRCEIGQAQASVIGAHGDDLLYGGKHCAEAFNALAKGLAALAYQPGGITYEGAHWCVEPHPGCPRRAHGKSEDRPT